MSHYLDPTTETWVIQIQRTTAAKQKLRRCQRVRGSRADAQAAEAKMIAELETEVKVVQQAQEQKEQQSQAAAVLGLDPSVVTKPRVSAKPPTLREFFSDRVAPRLRAICSPATQLKVVSCWQYLLFKLGDLRLDEITTEVIHRYSENMILPGAALSFRARKDGRPRKSKVDTLGALTVNKQLEQLKSSLRLAAEEGKLAAVPKVRMLPTDDAQEVVPPSEEEFDQIVRAAAEFRDVAPLLPEVTEFAAETGLRQEELMKLLWSQVEFSVGKRGALRIERRTRGRSRGGKPYRPKHGKTRTVPLSGRARAILDDLKQKFRPAPSDRLFPNVGGCPYVRIEHDPECKGTGYFWQAVERAGLKGKVTFHALRHLFACRCLARGIPMSVVSDYLGHSSIELTVKLYGRFSDDAREKWKWIELLDEPLDAIARRRMLTVVEGEGAQP
ncbi:MAG TPA: site-specific integrase [Polyangia bacterium]|jgi:Site-specific recombinase XerD|nr:site-specific integrase [Polyangia bacterium]